jgi:hypothetical protein
MAAAIMETKTLPIEMDLQKISTNAVDRYNDEDFSKTYNCGLGYLNSFYNNSGTYQGKFRSTDSSTPIVLTNQYEYRSKNYVVYKPDIKNVSNLFWPGSNDILTIQNAFQSLRDTHIQDESEKTKERYFLKKYFLTEALAQAIIMIKNIFKDVEINTNLYIDHDDPQCKFLNITIKPLSPLDAGIERLVDDFDNLIEQFLDSVDIKYTSMITFYLDIS